MDKICSSQLIPSTLVGGLMPFGRLCYEPERLRDRTRWSSVATTPPGTERIGPGRGQLSGIVMRQA